jgi:hypothetical protein
MKPASPLKSKKDKHDIHEVTTEEENVIDDGLEDLLAEVDEEDFEFDEDDVVEGFDGDEEYVLVRNPNRGSTEEMTK